MEAASSSGRQDEASSSLAAGALGAAPLTAMVRAAAAPAAGLAAGLGAACGAACPAGSEPLTFNLRAAPGTSRTPRADLG
jgi:hypothetical protein